MTKGFFMLLSAKNVKFCKKSLQIYFFAVYLQSQKIIGVWRSWLAHLVWDQRVLCSSHSTPTKEQLIFNCSFFCLPLTSATVIINNIHKNSLFYGYKRKNQPPIHKKALFYG